MTKTNKLIPNHISFRTYVLHVLNSLIPFLVSEPLEKLQLHTLLTPTHHFVRAYYGLVGAFHKLRTHLGVEVGGSTLMHTGRGGSEHYQKYTFCTQVY